MAIDKNTDKGECSRCGHKQNLRDSGFNSKGSLLDLQEEFIQWGWDVSEIDKEICYKCVGKQANDKGNSEVQ